MTGLAVSPAVPQDVDLLIIGGGIVGAGVARDAAMRGLRTLLVDRHDFAFGTSSRSSRLLHGGLRYLAQGRVGLVREASREKIILSRIAPHLARPLPFVFPTYRHSGWPKWKMRIGVKLYDLLCGKSNLGYSGGLSVSDVQTLLPGLARDGLTGAVRYYDGLTGDARLVLDTLRSAAAHGATLLNYTMLAAAERAGPIWRCELRGMSAEHAGEAMHVRAQAVVNAAGAWSPQLRHARVRLRQTKGVHLVIDRARLPIRDALVMTEGKRILFAIPWGERVILGTTDTDYTGPTDSPDCTPEDQAYVLGVVNRFFPQLQLRAEDVISAWSGLRPLIADPNGAPSDISRAHLIDEQDGWIDVAGGKLTTYRLMAEQAVDRVQRLLGRSDRASRTASEPIVRPHETAFSGIIPPEVSKAAVEHYCRAEYARHLDDVMIRRTSWRYYHREHLRIAERIAPWMAEVLGWSAERTAAELRRYRNMTQSLAPSWQPWSPETASEPVPADTTRLRVGRGVIDQTATVLRDCFGDRRAIVIADENTWRAAGRAVHEQLVRNSGAMPPVIFSAAPVLYAEMPNVDAVFAALADPALVPVAVGAGTLNDLVKLAAHRRGMGYMVVATAASMDGYTAFGASITDRGSKQTFDCPAPRGLVADIDVIAAAPTDLAATGYADLAAKITAGADWILADALGVEPIHAGAWACVQTPLRGWLAGPDLVRRGDPVAIENLVNGLVASGIGMQLTQDSRPASGAEHQFSHLWDMETHRHNGQPVSHGAKVAIGTLASAALYEALLALPLDELDVDAVCARWPTLENVERQIADLHAVPAIREKALVESRAKYIPAEILRRRLLRLRQQWPDLRRRLREQLIPFVDLKSMLAAAGAPVHPAQIGISLDRLRQSYMQALTIRRRFTVLDVAAQIGRLPALVDQLFAAEGVWS